MERALPQENLKPYGNQGDKTTQVEQMFNHIAPTYDRLNHILSFGIDRRWRKAVVHALASYAPQTVLDMAAGTGDFSILIAQKLRPAKVIAADISEQMLRVARQKAKKNGTEQTISFTIENCERLSFADNTFDAVTMAYGMRNFAHLEPCLQEILRVLKPGAPFLTIEFSRPVTFPMKQLFPLYAKTVMPLVGRIISNDPKAYSYLPATIAAFPQPETVKKLMLRTGFASVTFQRQTGGLSTLYLAQK